MSNETNLLGRRSLLRGAAVMGAGAALAACGADETNVREQDVGALNALLTAELKAIDAYTQGAGVLQAEAQGGGTQEARDLAALALAVAVEFQKDHKEHAALLSRTISQLGGAPVRENTPETRFTLPAGFKATTVNVLKLAANEERRAAIAYNQVVKQLKDPEDRFIAAAIEGDETQHFMVLAALIEGLVVPTDALVPEQVVPHPFVAGGPQALNGFTSLEGQPDLPVSG